MSYTTCLSACENDPADYLSSSEECLTSLDRRSLVVDTTSWISLQNGTEAKTKSGVVYTGSNGAWVSNDIDNLYDQSDSEWNPGNNSRIGDNCITFTGTPPHIQLKETNAVAWDTVYLMGSRVTYGDMVGLEIYLVQESTGIWIRCLEIVDGPGFYNCDSESAEILVIKGPYSDTSSSFVLCGIKRFESRSANLAISSASTNPVYS